MQTIRFTLMLSLLLLFAACSAPPPRPLVIEKADKKVGFLSDVRPILDKRCVVCHSCYNSPCQTKLSSFEGIMRGGSKAVIYNPERLSAQEPSRLFFDAHSTGQWREQGFFSVADNTAASGLNNATLAHLIRHKMDHPEIIGEYAPEEETWICPRNEKELGRYFADKPYHGMPYGFPALKPQEARILLSWLDQGASGPSAAEQRAMTTPTPQAGGQIEAWEAFLNRDDAKHVMTARYLYEHYYLAHFHFERTEREFFELVRSRTPSPRPIDVIATRRPYDDPGGKVYYRFRKVHATIVFKTHMVVEADPQRLERYRQLFIETPWIDRPHVMEYGAKRSANPFITYAQIPPEARYRFLLDNAKFIVTSFIRGPVCRGQVALNVIHDHFWVMFKDPEHDLTVQQPTFLLQEAHNLAMPNETGSDTAVYKLFSDAYRERYKAYFRQKIDLYDRAYPQGQGIEAIWRGACADDVPMMTVYRHFDSASVHTGPIGRLPRTAWVIDYPQFERIYYSLVAGFDVYGNISHQLNVRRYMDFLRYEGELNFIAFMPKAKQLEIFKSWYIGDSDIQSLQTIQWKRPSKIRYVTDDPKRELIERVVDTHLLPEANILFDSINYYRAGVAHPKRPLQYRSREDYIDGFRSLTRPGIGFLRHMVDNGANILYLRIMLQDEEDLFLSLVINRWHNSVTSLLDQSRQMDPAKDTIDFHIGSMGSYGNLFLAVEGRELPDFFEMMENFNGSPRYLERLKRYAISRSDPDFWNQYDWFQAAHDVQEPVRTGIMDLNRYFRKPF